MLLIVGYGTLLLVAVVVAACCAQDVWREHRSPRLEPTVTPLAEPPLVSVIVPARNEAARIGPCLEGLTQQQHALFDVVVMDDGSTDGTADVARAFAARLPALAVRKSAPLPDGWLGKCWACWQAAEHTHGEWLLFLDADVVPQPALISAMVAHAQAHQLDLLTLMPLQQFGSLAERLVLPAFITILLGVYPLHVVSDQRSPVAFANGQCILARRRVYDAVDGHRGVRGNVLEDAVLGQRVKAAGFRLVAAHAPDLLEVRMYTGWATVAEGFGKNAVAGWRSGGARSGLVGARQSLVAFAPWYVLGGALWAWIAAPASTLAWALLLVGLGLAAATLGTMAWLVRRRHRVAAAWGALYPLGLALYFGIAAWGFGRVATGRGIVWKGRTFHEEH